LRAGWISSRRCEALLAFESSSAQIGQRLPVRASTTSTGAAPRVYFETSVRPTGFVRFRAAGVSRPGTFARMTEPGLKPSSARYGAGSIGLPCLLRGICALVKAR
jgi:hypothetical protein